jgi:palmitoyl-protein thioesterase
MYKGEIILCFLSLSLFSINSINSIKPVVLLHGLESNANNLNQFAEWIRNSFNRTVYNVELGYGDEYSVDTPIVQQIEEFKTTVENISDLSNGFDFIGISQGGLIGRGYVQYYNNFTKFKVNNLITIVSPHGGVFYKYLSFINLYTTNMQDKFSFTNYWRDPTNLIKYKLFSSFLAGANNEKLIKNRLYKENINTLNNFVMVFSPNDEVVKPPESSIFSFYDSNLNVVNLTETELFKQDWLGLKSLYDRNSLHMFSANCSHTEYKEYICFSQLYPILSQFL